MTSATTGRGIGGSIALAAVCLGIAIGLPSLGLLVFDSWLHRDPIYDCAVALHDESYWAEHDIDPGALEVEGSWRLVPTGLTCTYPTNGGEFVDVPQNPSLIWVLVAAASGAVLAMTGVLGLGLRRKTVPERHRAKGSAARLGDI
jgi:hypothetical protein